jgi:hypothetical protein
MTDHANRFHAALIVLAGHGHVKQRLIKAFQDHLAEIHEDELPVAIKQDFADLRQEMHRVSPLNGEGPICASVRKMSLKEASDCAGRIVTLYGEIARLNDGLQPALPKVGDGEERVPPFLVKSI